ncbi:MAG: undecaprenyldiphospho-muramoylpentapeptide beta-N-acetylglucosaminyltransferase [Treponema sp.]|nr:undecaprenyldiphospho-muramoylpentapeptide beta-N-acetylglucosaminyltransferase [Treponema sp.]MCL2236813.1 undecaprenyldiphospho-muramoylpentapeptide beta-N-acetylglucosaminyltransferase [Treponema sp.]
MVNIAFTGGGTGGHIYPGLAVAIELKDLLKDLQYRIFWIGSSSGMDQTLVEGAGIEFFGVPSGKLRRYFSVKTIPDFFRVVSGFFASRKILKKNKASILFSKGGYVSVPPCAAACSLKIPVFTHESDYSPGLATKINSRFAEKTKGMIFTAYKDTARYFPENIRKRITVTGNPVRSCFRNADPAKGREFLKVSPNERILLILGGSQGAKEINDLVRSSLGGLTQNYTVVHQTGPNLEWDVPASEKYKPFPYIRDEMADVMAAAQIVMGRSGAGIWEWAVLGKPMLLIPLRGAGTRGDQEENALFFENAGAALVFGEGITSNELALAVNSFANDEEKRQKMAHASLMIGEQNGAKTIAEILFKACEKDGGNN